jgi:hypothetical protein
MDLACSVAGFEIGREESLARQEHRGKEGVGSRFFDDSGA